MVAYSLLHFIDIIDAYCLCGVLIEFSFVTVCELRSVDVSSLVSV